MVRADETDAADVVRLLAHEEAVAADVLVGVLDAGRELTERHAVTAQAERIDFDMVLLGLAAVARDVDDPLNLLELTLQNPILGGLQILERVAIAHQPVPVNLADGVPGRELTLQARGQLHELEPVDDFLSSFAVWRIPVEIRLHVAQSEERGAPDVVEARHARQADLQRDRDVALGLFRAPPRRLREHFDERGARVGVGLDVELAVRRQAEQDQQRAASEHQQGHPKGGNDDPVNHFDVPRFELALRVAGRMRRRRAQNGQPEARRARFATDACQRCSGFEAQHHPTIRLEPRVTSLGDRVPLLSGSHSAASTGWHWARDTSPDTRLCMQKGHAPWPRVRSRTPARHSCSGRFEHCQKQTRDDPASTSRGPVRPFFDACHSAAMSGKHAAKLLVLETRWLAQNGHPVPRVRLLGLARQT